MIIMAIIIIVLIMDGSSLRTSAPPSLPLHALRSTRLIEMDYRYIDTIATINVYIYIYTERERER